MRLFNKKILGIVGVRFGVIEPSHSEVGNEPRGIQAPCGSNLKITTQ